jgi:hypothetical protein
MLSKYLKKLAAKNWRISKWCHQFWRWCRNHWWWCNNHEWCQWHRHPQTGYHKNDTNTQTGLGSDGPGGYHWTSYWIFFFKGPQTPLEELPKQQNHGTPGCGFQCRPLLPEKGKPKPFPYLTRQVPKSWHKSNGIFQTHGRRKLRIKCLDHSASRECFKPGFDLILSTNTLKV